MCRSKDDSFRPPDPAAPSIPEGRTAGEGDAAPSSLAASMASLPPQLELMPFLPTGDGSLPSSSSSRVGGGGVSDVRPIFFSLLGSFTSHCVGGPIAYRRRRRRPTSRLTFSRT